MLPLSLSEIATLVGGDLDGPGDLEIRGVAGLAAAGAGDLSFLAKDKAAAIAESSAASALLVARKVVVTFPCIRVDDPYVAFARVLQEQQIAIDRAFPPEIHETAVVAAGADVSRAASIGPYCVIGDGVVLGDNVRLGAHVTIGCDVVLGDECRLYPQVVLREGCRLGKRVVVHSGVILGSDGFGYVPQEDGLYKVPQVGIVEIDDDVELGACVTVDRATTGVTRIGKGSKLDNQVQIAHNVEIGSHCALSSQTGIAGSCRVGDGVVFGGQVGVGDHISIGSGCQLGGQSGVTSDLSAGSRVFGTPAQDAKDSFRTTAAMRRLPEMQLTVRSLKRHLAELETRLAKAEEQLSGLEPDEEHEA